MPNLFSEVPDVKEPALESEWSDPTLGLHVPMAPDRNLAFRARLLAEAERDKEFQQDIFTACSQSIEYFILTMCFTLRVFEADQDGNQRQATNTHLPFVLWPAQLKLVRKLYEKVSGGGELLVDKSRDMGATWVHLVVLVWFFLFRSSQSILLISRKEDAVDQLDGMARNYPRGSLADPGTLFGKVDYILSRLPEWMLPALTRKKLHLVNVTNNSRIDGESANATAGTSDRRTAIMLDEFAKVEEAESIKRSTRDVTACRLVVSTPNGAGTTFSKWRNSGQIEVFPLMWWTHPEKARGLNVRQDKMGRWRIHSPWYDKECDTRSPREVAIEIDADHTGSGDTFFEAQVLEQHRKLFCKPPRRQCNVVWRKKLADEDIVRAIGRIDLTKIALTPAGPLGLWVDLVGNRLDQTKTYIITIDISKGQGASNSVMAIGCVETREKVGEWANADTPPYELARLACALGLWVGGRTRRPLICWENNGDAGLDFGRQLVHVYRYPNVYFDKATGTLRQKTGKRYGWRSSPDKKAEALGLLRRAYAHGRYINHSAMALVEAASYITYEGGGIGPAELVQESASTRKAHGDRVIADMLFVWCLADAGRIRKVEIGTPQRCLGKRFEEYKKRKRADKSGRPAKTFNFAELV